MHLVPDDRAPGGDRAGTAGADGGLALWVRYLPGRLSVELEGGGVAGPGAAAAVSERDGGRAGGSGLERGGVPGGAAAQRDEAREVASARAKRQNRPQQ